MLNLNNKSGTMLAVESGGAMRKSVSFLKRAVVVTLFCALGFTLSAPTLVQAEDLQGGSQAGQQSANAQPANAANSTKLKNSAALGNKAVAKADTRSSDGLEVGPEIIGQPVRAAAKPKVNSVFAGHKTVSGKITIRFNQRKRTGLDVTIHVTVNRQAGGTEEKTATIPPTTTSQDWTVTLASELAEGDKVTVKQEYNNEIFEDVVLEVKKSLADQHKDKIKMPKGEIWIERPDANLVNKDEQTEAIEMLKNANPDIANDFDLEKTKFSIDGTDHAYYEVTYTDKTTSGKIEATDLKIKQVTKTSTAPTIQKVQITDKQIIVTLDKEVAEGTKFYFINNFTDGEDNKFSENGSCIVDKSTLQEMSQAVSIDGKKVTFPISDGELELGKKFGIVVKEPHKFRSCAKSEPVVTTPDKVAVRDPHKLTDADKKAIDKAIRDANTVNGVSKLPNGSDYEGGVPAVIRIDDSGKAEIFSGADVKGDWDSEGNYIPEKNEDGSYKLNDGAEPKITIPAKDLVKNIKPDAPEIKLNESDKTKITINAKAVDTDANVITVFYTGSDDSSKTLKATKADDGTWSITEGEGTVDEHGVVTLKVSKVKGGTKVTATVTDKGGIADDDKDALTSDQAEFKVTKAILVEALGGLDPVDIKKWVGDDIDWKNGVEAKDPKNKAEVDKLLGEEKTSFTDENSRGTTDEGDFKGKIKVAFDDGSFIEVDNQNLYVSNHVTSTERKDKVPTDALDVQLKLGEGVKVEDKDPNTGAVTKTTKGDKDNPVLYKEYKVKPGTDLSAYKHSALKKTIFDLIDEKADKGYVEPVVWKGQDANNPNNFVAAADNRVFTATATKTFKVTVKPNGGTGDEKVEIKKKDETFKLPAANTFTPPNENQEFSGWKIGDDNNLKQPETEITITGDTEINAIWKPIEFKVDFKAGEGASGSMEDKTVTKGSEYELPTPTFTAPKDKVFAGWKVGDQEGVKQAKERITITGNVTLTATWKDNTVNVTFEGAGGGGSMEKASVTKGSKYTLPNNGFTAPENKKFDGWKIGEKEYHVGEEITVSSNTTVTAIWKDIEYKVNFDGNGGTGKMDEKTAKKGETFKLPSNGFTTPAGKEFSGWEVNGQTHKVGDSITVNGDVTVKALWKDKPVPPATTPGKDKPGNQVKPQPKPQSQNPAAAGKLSKTGANGIYSLYASLLLATGGLFLISRRRRNQR